MPATPAKKTTKVTPRPLTSSTAPKAAAKPATTAIDDASDVVEKTTGERINLGAETLEQDVEMVTVVVPHRFTLTRDNRTPVTIFPGVQEMSLTDAAHWYSRANGVKVYTPS
jgi:hypothetical protein